MERRTFCELTSLALASTIMSLPFTGCSGPDPSLVSRLSLPTTMASINDSATISAVGMAYMKQVPAESNATALVDRLLAGHDGKDIPETTDSLALQKILSQKVLADFEKGEYVVVNGWVLSRTEARQYALYSLN